MYVRRWEGGAWEHSHTLQDRQLSVLMPPLRKQEEGLYVPNSTLLLSADIEYCISAIRHRPGLVAVLELQPHLQKG